MPILKLSSNYYWFLQWKHCIYNWKIYISSAKSLTFDIKLFGRSFMYVKNRNGPKIDPCSTPALISSQWEFWPLSKTLWYLLSRKLWKSVSKLLETPIAFNLYMKLHAKLYQNLLTYPKIWSAFQKMESYQKIHNFCALYTKVDLHMN